MLGRTEPVGIWRRWSMRSGEGTAWRFKNSGTAWPGIVVSERVRSLGMRKVTLSRKRSTGDMLISITKVK